MFYQLEIVACPHCWSRAIF